MALVVAEEVVLLVEAVVASAAVALPTVFEDEVCCSSCHVICDSTFLEANS